MNTVNLTGASRERPKERYSRMISAIEFTKLSGSGNDFLCIDNRDGRFDDIIKSPARAGHFARTLCRRGLGVGADGIVFACESEVEDFAHIAARFLETDGSEALLCGNGTACFIHWATRHGIVPDGEVKILTPAGVVRGQDLDGDYIRVCIPIPHDIRTDLSLIVDGRVLNCDHIVAGVPHLVTYVDDIRREDIATLGPLLRHHEYFAQPPGVNANFVQQIAPGEIAIRTYEFGVEAETLACGTGSAAAAILSGKRFNWPAEFTTGKAPVIVHAPSGDILRVYYILARDGSVTDPCLETIVRCTYTGVLCDDLAATALADPKVEQ